MTSPIRKNETKLAVAAEEVVTQERGYKAGPPRSARWCPELNTPLYLWRVEKLKADMVAHPLSERQIIPYVVLDVFLSVIAGRTTQSQSPQGIVDLTVGFCAVLAVVATIYIYRQNGGAAGQHFLQRYLTIGWVVSVRCFPILFLVSIYVRVILRIVGVERPGVQIEEAYWHYFISVALYQVIVWWRISYHVRDLAQRAAAHDHKTNAEAVHAIGTHTGNPI
jgi:hypothetical protein